MKKVLILSLLIASCGKEKTKVEKVEVPKIVVEKEIVEVPQIVKEVQIVEVEKLVETEVPVEVEKIVEKIIEAEPELDLDILVLRDAAEYYFGLNERMFLEYDKLDREYTGEDREEKLDALLQERKKVWNDYEQTIKLLRERILRVYYPQYKPRLEKIEDEIYGE